MFGRKVEIALIEKGLEFEREYVPFTLTRLYDPIHPMVDRVNPKCQVPVLLDGEMELFDSTLIFEYLEDTYPSQPLWPSNPKTRAQARLIELKADEVFFPNVQMFMPHERAAFANEDRAHGAAVIHGLYHQWDRQLAETDAYLQTEFSYADIAAFLASFFATFLGHAPSAELQSLQVWKTRMMKRSSIKNAVSEMTSILAGKAN